MVWRNKSQCWVALLFRNKAVAVSPLSRKIEREKRIHLSQTSIQVSNTHKQSHVRRWYGSDGSSTWPGYCPVAAEECCEGSAVWERESERAREIARQRATLRQDLCATLPKLTGGDNLQTWSRIPESGCTRHDATTVKKKKKKKKQQKECCLYSDWNHNRTQMPSCTCVQVPVLSWSLSFSNQNMSTWYRSHPKLK